MEKQTILELCFSFQAVQERGPGARRRAQASERKQVQGSVAAAVLVLGLGRDEDDWCGIL